MPIEDIDEEELDDFEKLAALLFSSKQRLEFVLLKYSHLKLIT